MPEILIRRKFFDKAIARKIEVPKVNDQYIEGVVFGLRVAFDMTEYEIDVSQIDAHRALMQGASRATAAAAQMPTGTAASVRVQTNEERERSGKPEGPYRPT